MDDGTMEMIGQALEATLSHDNSARREAEKVLFDLELQLGFAETIFHFIAGDGISDTVRLSAALCFKNYVKRHWAADGECEIPAGERDWIRAHIVDFMCDCNEAVMRQLSAAMATITTYDFPTVWPDLLENLVSRFEMREMRVTVGVLQTAHSVFERFRTAYHDDDTQRQLVVDCMDAFGEPLTVVFEEVVAVVLSGEADPATMQLAAEAVMAACDCFQDLSSIDIPELFETRLASWCDPFLALLELESAVLSDDADDYHAGKLEKMKTSVMECATLYATKYDEQFEDYLSPFLEASWVMLTTLGPQSKYDRLVVVSILYISRLATQAWRRSMFEGEGTLATLMEGVILPNMRLREEDMERFEDEPVEYIRRDIEGSDRETRRRSACDLVKHLLMQFKAEITELAYSYLEASLAAYTADPAGAYEEMDLCITLLLAVSVERFSQRGGASQVNDLVDVAGFYGEHIVPLLEGDVEENPVLKADAIKFVGTFRNQLGLDAYEHLFPLLVQHLQASNYIVHTYAAWCLHRMMTVRDPHTRQRVVDKNFIQPVLTDLLNHALGVLEAAEVPDNDYVMECVLRAAHLADDTVAPHAEWLLEKVTSLIKRVSANPQAPRFNHYLFECVASLVNSCCTVDASLVSSFEDFLFPPFQKILSDGITEFTQYVFQIFALLLELGSRITDAWMAFLVPLKDPVLWELRGNVPGLARLIAAYFKLDAAAVSSAGHVPEIVELCRTCMQSRFHASSAFSMMTAMVEHLPAEGLAETASALVEMAFSRMMSYATRDFVRQLVRFLSVFVIKHGGDFVIGCIDSLGGGVAEQFLRECWIDSLGIIQDSLARKICCIGMVKLLCESEAMQAEPFASHAPNAFHAMARCLVGIVDDVEAEDAIAEGVPEEYSSYSAAYSQLAYAQCKLAVDPLPEGTAREMFGVIFFEFCTAHPDAGAALLAPVTPDIQTRLAQYMGGDPTGTIAMDAKSASAARTGTHTLSVFGKR